MPFHFGPGCKISKFIAERPRNRNYILFPTLYRLSFKYQFGVCFFWVFCCCHFVFRALNVVGIWQTVFQVQLAVTTLCHWAVTHDLPVPQLAACSPLWRITLMELPQVGYHGNSTLLLSNSGIHEIIENLWLKRMLCELSLITLCYFACITGLISPGVSVPVQVPGGTSHFQDQSMGPMASQYWPRLQWWRHHSSCSSTNLHTKLWWWRQS